MWWVHGSEGGFYTYSRRPYARKAPPPFLHKLGHGHYFGPSRTSYPDGPPMGTMNGHYYRKRLWQGKVVWWGAPLSGNISYGHCHAHCQGL